jgi:carboxyl-terminal processing protease
LGTDETADDIPDNIAYIKISYFSKDTDDELISLLGEIPDQGVDGVILDLRDNPGGVVNAAAEVADQFLDEGNIFRAVGEGEKWIEEYGGKIWVWEAKSNGLITEDIKVAVLVNGPPYSIPGTASAAEIVAGALQDSDGSGYERVCLIGTETYGKGCMCVICSLSDGSAIQVTCAHWYSPLSDTYLTPGNGLIPDYYEEDEDEQLEQAIAYIIGSEVVLVNGATCCGCYERRR